jgi:hypothetical protein
MTDITHETATRIAALNDLLRKGGFGGTVYFTSGVRERGQAFVIDALRAVREFAHFTPDNDPYGEHDFGAVLVPEKFAAPVQRRLPAGSGRSSRPAQYREPSVFRLEYWSLLCNQYLGALHNLQL